MIREKFPNPSSEHLGIIGERQLVAVQTLDIARLTGNPVCIVPETFIAVTGRGPVDSNESGKTSFLAAVSLLLGDPEWQVSGPGAASVEALLFEPITAGATAGVNGASEGYIVGVFASPEDVFNTAHTVWLRISANRPHLQVRHSAGLHIATGEDDRDRHELAPQIFKSLKCEPLGGMEYANALYGRSPRVLAYVASRGRVRSRPSLLKLDAGTFAPEEIGEALITLTGRASLFERDQQDRRDIAVKQQELSKFVKRDHDHIVYEDRVLRQIDVRNRLRSYIDESSECWSSFRARCVLDAFVKAESASLLLSRTQKEKFEIEQEVKKYMSEQDAHRNKKALEEVIRRTSKMLTDRKLAYENALRTEVKLESALDGLEQDLRANRTLAEGHNLDIDGSALACASARDSLEEELRSVQEDLSIIENEVAELEREFERAQVGQFGVSGKILQALAEVGISSEALAESVCLADDLRSEWEARLFPWKDAVCVSHEFFPDAIQAVSDIPGAILISSYSSVGHRSSMVEMKSAESFPPGIESAPGGAMQLLEVLASHEVEDVPVIHAVDHLTGIHIVGGFPIPVIGGDALRIYLRESLRRGRERLSDLRRVVEIGAMKLEAAAISANRAQAAERESTLVGEVGEASQLLSTHRVQVLPVREAEQNDAWNAHADAKRTFEDRERILGDLAKKVREASSRLSSKSSEIEKLGEISRPADAVLAAWGRGKDAALIELGWPSEMPALDVTGSLQEEAEPPPMASEEWMRAERRNAATLAEAARSKLTAALAVLEANLESVGNLPSAIQPTIDSYKRSLESGDMKSAEDRIDSVLDSMRGWLEDDIERDLSAPERIANARSDRAKEIDFVSSSIQQLRDSLIQTQEAITQRAAAALDRISVALDELNRGSNGLGAILDYDIVPPEAPDQDWVCKIVPRWRRNPGGPLLSYDNVTNTAQEKLFSIHLVLASLLSAPHPRGRVLILDELADSLGAEHRREVLDVIGSVAKRHGITILATCQDGIMVEARPYCGQVLYFQYPSKSHSLNRPTRMFGFDSNRKRIELNAESLLEGRA
jgi:chromosome segregation protein